MNTSANTTLKGKRFNWSNFNHDNVVDTNNTSDIVATETTDNEYDESLSPDDMLEIRQRRLRIAKCTLVILTVVITSLDLASLYISYMCNSQTSG